MKNRAASNLFNNNSYIIMILKIVTMACCASSFLRMQSFQIYNGRVLELKYYCEETLE